MVRQAGREGKPKDMARPELHGFDKLGVLDAVYLELRLFVFPDDYRSELFVRAQGKMHSGTGELDTGKLLVLSVMMVGCPFQFRLNLRIPVRGGELQAVSLLVRLRHFRPGLGHFGQIP